MESVWFSGDTPALEVLKEKKGGKSRLDPDHSWLGMGIPPWPFFSTNLHLQTALKTWGLGIFNSGQWLQQIHI